MKGSANQFKTLLRQHKLKATLPRLAVLGILSEKHQPLSAQDIARRIGHSVDPVTVYRTIESFLALGMIKRLDLRRGEACFELSSRPDHHHLVCQTCGLTEDFQGCHSNEIIKHALKQSRNFTKVSEHSLELFGICRNCR